MRLPYRRRGQGTGGSPCRQTVPDTLIRSGLEELDDTQGPWIRSGWGSVVWLNTRPLGSGMSK